MPTCDCITKVNAKLAEKNLALKLHPTISFGDPNATEVKYDQALAIETVSLKKGAKPIKLFLAFCPFCGESKAEKKVKAQRKVNG